MRRAGVHSAIVGSSLAAVAFAAFAGTDAAARPDVNLVIRPAIGIGKVRLGMTEAQLRRAMGRPRAVVRRGGSFGLRRIEYEYGFAAYVVRLSGRRQQLRVVAVGTTLPRERTVKGIGPGSRERDALRAYPAARCARLELWSSRTGGGTPYVVTRRRTCTLFSATGRRTTFASSPPRGGPFLTRAQWTAKARIVEVTVSEPT
jgi:hypothetical protein